MIFITFQFLRKLGGIETEKLHSVIHSTQKNSILVNLLDHITALTGLKNFKKSDLGHICPFFIELLMMVRLPEK